MTAHRRPAPPLVSVQPGSVPFRTGPRLLWMSGLFLAACLLGARPAGAQSFGLGISTVSASPVSGWSIWTEVSVDLRSHRSHRWGCPGHRFGGGYHYRGWGWWGPVHRGPFLGHPYLGRGAHRCIRTWDYGFGWSRPAFGWALYPIPLPYGGHPGFGYGWWSSPWSFDLHISLHLGPGYRWYGGHGYAGRGYGHRWYGAPWYAGGYGRHAAYGYGYRPSRAEARRPPRTRRAAAPARVGSAGWVSRDRARDVASPPRGQLRTARARTASSPATRQAQPAGRRALSRTGPVATSPAAGPDIRAGTPGRSPAAERATAGATGRQRLARTQSSVPRDALPENRTGAAERRGSGAAPLTRTAGPRRATTPAPPSATASAPAPGTTASPLRSARTRPSRPASPPGAQTATPRRATRPAPRPSVSPPQTAPRTTADPQRASRARPSRPASPLGTSRPAPSARTAPRALPSTPRSRPAVAPRPSARPAPAGPDRGVLGRSGPRRSSAPAAGRAPVAGGRRATR